MMIYSAPTGFEGSALHARIFGTGIVVCELTGSPRPLALDSSCDGERYHTILKNSSFRGRGVFSPSCIRARNLRDHFHSIFCSYQKGFAEASFHLVDFANRSSIFCKRRNHVTQFSNVKVNAPLQELLLLIHQEPAVRILKERIFTDRLAFP